MNKIIGRAHEIEMLDRCYNSHRAEFVVISGRRRIGKTYLINALYGEQFAFSYVGGHNLSIRQQLRKFALALSSFSHQEVQAFSDWFEAFEALQTYLSKLPHKEGKRKLVFLDEMPWIDNKTSDFVAALEYFWNSWGALQDDLMFIASGSATSWLNDKLTENKGGLHARITKQIVLTPFTLKETEQYLDFIGADWDRYQIIQAYMVLGGIPFYLSLIDSQLSMAQNIDQLFFSPSAQMQLEFDELYYALFSGAERYISVVKALAEKRNGLTRSELMEQTHLPNPTLGRLLKNLEKSNFITCYQQMGHTMRNNIYRLTDLYTLFYFHFIENNHTNDSAWWTHNMLTPKVMAWQGFSFELVCLLHLDEIKKALGISGISTSAFCWRAENAQIDLVIDRADRLVNLCEMKFSTELYAIEKNYADKIRERVAIFREKTKCKKGIQTTFVTTYGVANGKHSAVAQSQITMDDLFV